MTEYHDKSVLRRVVKLHFTDKYAYSEIGDMLGMTRNAVAGIINRNRDRVVLTSGYSMKGKKR